MKTLFLDTIEVNKNYKNEIKTQSSLFIGKLTAKFTNHDLVEDQSLNSTTHMVSRFYKRAWLHYSEYRHDIFLPFTYGMHRSHHRKNYVFAQGTFNVQITHVN